MSAQPPAPDQLAALTAQVGQLAEALPDVIARLVALERRPPGDQITLNGPTPGSITEAALSAAVQAKINPTAWEGLALGPKIETAGLQAPAVRGEDGSSMARLRGGLKVKAAEELKAGETLFTVPAGFRPPGLVEFPIITATGSVTIMKVAATGVVTLKDTIVPAQTIFLDGETYNVT